MRGLAGLGAALLFAGLLSPQAVRGQAVNIIYSFGDNAADGNFLPAGGVIQGSDGALYGTSNSGGANNVGAVYKVLPASGQEALLYSFPTTGSGVYDPASSLLQATDGSLYGFGEYGGTFGLGGIFRVTTGAQPSFPYSSSGVNGDETTAFFPIPDIDNQNQPNPPPAPSTPPEQGSLIQGSDGNFYGTESGDQAPPSPGIDQDPDSGCVFKMTPSGQVTIIHSFGDGTVQNDGQTPLGPLIQASDGNFYSTTSGGGTKGNGMIFEVTPQGNYTIFYNFGGGGGIGGGSQPVNPSGGLIQGADGSFYGTSTYSSGGGDGGAGTIFKITQQGVLTVLHTFSDGTISNDGKHPLGGLVRGPDGNFYGTTYDGGIADYGIIFEITPQGRYTILHQFNDGTIGNDGQNPACALIVGSDGNLYGTTGYGGANDEGAVFQVELLLPALSSLPNITGYNGVPFTYTTRGTLSTTSFTAANLPPGLNIDSTTGIISGTPMLDGFYTAQITLTNPAGSNTVDLNFAINDPPVPVITSVANAYGTVNSQFSYTVTATYAPTGYSMTGSVPGLLFDTGAGVLSGKPTTPGTYPLTFTASNATGPSNSTTVTVQIFSATAPLGQEYQILHRFNDGSVTSDSEYPSSIFLGFDGTLYGAAQAGGSGISGSVFNATLGGLTSVFASFGTAPKGANYERTTQGLVQGSDGNFYGTAQEVGGSTGGIFYRITPDGLVTPLHNFGDGTVSNDGQAPMPGLIQGFDGYFYGVTEFGGSANEGCVYRVDYFGAVTILHSFGDGSVTNDGEYPTAGLIQGTDHNFYGTTFAGGSSTANAGVIFKMTPQGIVTILHSFGDGSALNDGAQPGAPLLQAADGNFYGTTEAGGSFDSGCVFELTQTNVFSILHNFADGSVTNDGDTPESPLIQGLDGNFYGTTTEGGSAGDGTIFSITSGGAVTIIHSFGDGTTTDDGVYPTSLFQAPNGNFYGTTEAGGAGTGFGTIFAILAQQTADNVPIFTGSAYGTSPINAPFSYTPKAEFGTSGSGAETPQALKSNALVSSGEQKADEATNWTLSGTLPSDLTFDMTSGTISGVPLVSGVFTVTVTPHNSVGAGQPTTVTLYIDVPPTVTSLPSGAGDAQAGFMYVITATASPSLYGATNLPGWLTVDESTGLLTGTPPSGGTYVFNVSAENFAGVGSKQVIVSVTGGAANTPQIISATTVNGSAGMPLSYQIKASNSPTAYSAMILPVGLTCNSATGAIAGTPTTAGTYSVPISVTNANGTTAGEVTFVIASPGPPTLPGSLAAQAVINSPFSYTIPAQGLVSIYSAGNLPAGLTLNSATGLIYGMPTASGTTAVSVSASNGMGTATGTLQLSVGAQTTQTFAQWISQFNVTGGATGDPANDGVPNLLKYLYDLNPTTAVSPTERSSLAQVGTDATTTPNTTYLTLTYRQFALETGITVNVQTSPDLQNWTTVTPDIDQKVGTDPTTGDPIMEVGVNVTNISTEYIRLNVTINP